jgi:hypothetical protein
MDQSGYVIECDKSFYCALFCVFMTRVGQYPISLPSERPIFWTLPFVPDFSKRGSGFGITFV